MEKEGINGGFVADLPSILRRQTPAISFDLREIAGNCKGNNAGGPLNSSGSGELM